MRIVIDSNVLVAAVRSNRGWSHKLIRSIGADPRWQPCVTAPLLHEYAEQIHHAGHTPAWTPENRDDFLDYFCASSRWCEVHFLWRPLLADEDDHVVLEAAMASSAVVIVSFNKRDLRPAEGFGISLMTPREFLLSLHP
jgi:putative PIN family toxin of toxin-antitoxin system